MMFIDCRLVVVYGVTGSKYLEYNSSIRTEKYTELSNTESNKRRQNGKSPTIKLVIDNTGTE
jgi:hypothetical protein